MSEVVESMEDLKGALEESYKMMGDGAHSTDDLIAWKHMEELLESKEAINVTICGHTRGGAIAMVEGLRAFIPVSRIALERVDDLNKWLDKEITVQVIEADMNEDKLVLSTTDLLKAKKKEDKDKKLMAINIGDVVTGTVDSIQNYGAFIKISDEVSGLLHISQISMERIKHPAAVLKVGDEVTARVIDKKDGKISLSVRVLLEEEKEKEEMSFEEVETEAIGTSLGDLLKGLDF